MNSKKGKKKSKPHPTPIVASNKEEKKEIHEEVEQLENTAEKECTVETIGEVVLAEVKSEDAAPKKPKRNRGKNKKQDKEEALSDEHKQREVEKDLCDTLTTADPVSVSNLDFKTDDKDNLDSSNNKCEECETVTPTTRKKKNKKKDNKTNIENLSKSQPTSALKENEPSKIEENITEPLKLSEAENLMKSNKKNKKKNRLDSGASDKVQEISCATAFQAPTEGVDVKSISVLVQDSSQNENISVKETNTTDYFRKISETDDAQEVLQKSNEEIDTFKEEAILTEESSKHEIQESKLPSKNNNKKINKDDIQQKIEAYFHANKDQEKILKLPPIKTEESKNLAEETLNDSLATSIESTHLDVRDTDIKVIHKNNESAGSPIVKAIIAKPVEKIKKGKKDRHEVENKEVEIFDSENNMNKASQEETITEKNTIINVEDSESKGNTVPQDIKSQDCQHVDEHLTLSQEVEVINIPDSAMGKKRKKSPKIPRVVIPEPAAPKEEILHVKKGDKQAPETTTTIPIDSEKAVIETQTEIISQIERNINSSDISKNAPEPKSRRKGKKSQKAPLTPGVTDFIPTFGMESKTPFVEFEAYLPEKTEEHKILSPEITTYNILEPLTVGQENKYDEKDITDIPFIDTEVNSNISTVSITRENDPIESLKSEQKPAEVNESSIVTDSCKTEVETPTLDKIPDIHYPRSTSQGYDGNNNTVIQEMRPDELQLPSVKDSPVIQGSGETPIGTPKMIISDIVISEVPETENLMEKTDLKSKMLEVNRDMEELRMSIERSLAGFTALETSEEKIEKEYEDKIKIDTEERDISKNSTEKSDVAIDKDVKQSLVTSELITDDANKTKTLSTLDKQPSSKKEDTETMHSVEEFSEKININETVNKRDDDPEKNTEEFLPVSGENIEQKTELVNKKQDIKCSDPNQPIHPSRKDNKGKNKKRKGKQEAAQSVQTSQSNSEIKNVSKENSNKKEEKCEKTEHSTSNSQEKSKQQADTELPETKEESPNIDNEFVDSTFNIDFEPIENFEDALTSSTEDADINKSFDMIVNETNIEIQQKLAANKPEIKIIGPDEKPKEKVTPPKNLLGHPDIPVPSNRTDYKKEKNKTPNTKQAKVKIKDSVEIELPENYKTDKENTELPETLNNELQNQKSDIFDNQIKGNNTVTYNKSQNDIKENGQHQHAEEPDTVLTKNDPSKSFTDESYDEIKSNKKLIKTENVENRKQSTQSQTENRKSKKNIKNKDSLTQLKENEEFVYKYSFRKVFLQNACNVCKKELKLRVACNFCNLLFYCSNKHKDEDWPQHQALCFAISTIGHMKDQKYIYADTKNITGQNYRLVRMQMILSCEKVLKRRLVPWEQELLLYPRICAEASCRQWKQTKLKDCEGCGQISYCMDKPEHLPKTHQRWCKSYSLYQKLVIHQQTKGRLEPKMPTKVMAEPYQIPDKINEVLASIYEEKIDMNDVQYAALTQLATAPLTAAYAHQVYANKVSPTTNGITKKQIFTIHVVGAELQFEADALNKWEVFFLHLRPDVQELKVVLISTDLNPSNLPLDLLAKIKHCENCRTNKRRVTFSFQDKKKYAEYRSSMDYCYPDLICAFNPSIQRSSVYKDLDTWPSTLNTVLRSKVPFVITAYSIAELLRDLIRVKECVEIDYKVISEAKYNSFASVRPDRNFITDDEMPLLFKNYCFMIICGC